MMLFSYKNNKQDDDVQSHRLTLRHLYVSICALLTSLYRVKWSAKRCPYSSLCHSVRDEPEEEPSELHSILFPPR